MSFKSKIKLVTVVSTIVWIITLWRKKKMKSDNVKWGRVKTKTLFYIFTTFFSSFDESTIAILERVLFFCARVVTSVFILCRDKRKLSKWRWRLPENRNEPHENDVEMNSSNEQKWTVLQKKKNQQQKWKKRDENKTQKEMKKKKIRNSQLVTCNRPKYSPY